MAKIVLKNLKETNKLAEKVVKEVLTVRQSVGAAVIALQGDLGSGKTTFAQAFARVLGVKSRITSPTFLIIKPYKLKAKSYKLLCHIDAYRLNSPQELLELGFTDLLKDPTNIILIEWADKIKELLPKNARWLRFAHGKKEEEREVEM